ncbi:MAG: hypothetical protein ACRDWH_02070 [Acidimicrobiia bacterium]
MPSRIERRLFRLLDELKMIESETVLIQAELEAHRHIDSDAHRDAALGIEPLESTLTRDDVARFERLLSRLELRRRFLEAKRIELLERLND